MCPQHVLQQSLRVNDGRTEHSDEQSPDMMLVAFLHLARFRLERRSSSSPEFILIVQGSQMSILEIERKGQGPKYADKRTSKTLFSSVVFDDDNAGSSN